MEKTNKTDLINKISKDESVPIRTVRKVISAFLNDIAKDLQAGHEVMLGGFGTFYVTKSKGRNITNPKTGLKKTYKANYRIGFKPSNSIKPRNEEVTEQQIIYTPLPEDYYKKLLNADGSTQGNENRKK